MAGQSSPNPEKLKLIELAQERADRSGDPHATMFDARWYWQHHADVRASDLDPWSHYLSTGKVELRQINEFFLPAWYLSRNPDVGDAGQNPTDHYVTHGFTEGRAPGPEFDAEFYRSQLEKPLPVDVDPLAHFLKQGDRSRYLVNSSLIATDVMIDRLGANEEVIPTRIAVGIVAYNNSKIQMRTIIGSAIESINIAGASISAQILVFDNGCSIDRQSLPFDVKLISNGHNNGFGFSQNAMMFEAFQSGVDCYIGANPDGAFHPDAISNLLKMSQRHGHRALIEAVQFPDEHPKYYHPQNLNTEWCSGSCFILGQKIWDETGGFDDNIFLYCEDVDFSWRVRHAGFETLVCPSAMFYHDVSGREYSSFIRRESLIASRYLARKWDCPEFESFTAHQLVAEGFFPALEALPDLDWVKVIDDARNVSNFDHLLAFAKTRW